MHVRREPLDLVVDLFAVALILMTAVIGVSTGFVNVTVEYWAETIGYGSISGCRTQCSLRPGGFLASIENATEQALVYATIPGGDIWMLTGGNRKVNDTTMFHWTEGPLGLEDGGLGRVFFTGTVRGNGACPPGVYCNWDPGHPGGGDIVVLASSRGGVWFAVTDGFNGACACKRFKSDFFTTALPAVTTTVERDCNTRCWQQKPDSYAAFVTSAQENEALTLLFFPRKEAYFVLGANSRGDGTHFVWTVTGTSFFEKDGNCTPGVYCNFNTLAVPPEPSSDLNETQVVIYAGNMSGNPTGSWYDMNLNATFGGCACRTYIPPSLSRTPTSTNDITSEETLTQTVTSEVTTTVTMTQTTTPTLTDEPTASYTRHVGYERFRYWFVEASLPTQLSCNVFCATDGGFPSYATSHGENLRVMASIPPHIHTALLGGSRSNDSTIYRWVAGPLGARNDLRGTPFFNGATVDTGNCTLYCNFASGLPNATGTATDVLMFGQQAGSLYGQWMNGDPGVGEGCACMSIVFHTFTQNVSRSESSSVSLSSPNPYWLYPLASATQSVAQCQSGCAERIGGQMASIRSAVEQQMALSVLPDGGTIGQVLLGGGQGGGNYRWTEGIFAKSFSLVWSGTTTLYGGSCLQAYCNFVTVSATVAAGLTVQQGAYITMWADGPLRGSWGEGSIGDTKGCLCQRAEVTVSWQLTKTRSVSASRTASMSNAASDSASATLSLTLTNDVTITMTPSSTVSVTPSTSPSLSPTESTTPEPTSSVSLSFEWSASTTRSQSPVPIDFWYYAAPNPTVNQCREFCALRKGGFIATVENSVEAAQVAKTLPSGAVGMLGGSRLTDANNFRWTEGLLGAEDGGLGRKFYAGASSLSGACVTYCNWLPGQPFNGVIAYAWYVSGGAWNDAGVTDGTGCVCKRYNTYSLRMSPTATIVKTLSITEMVTASMTSSDQLSPSMSTSSSAEPSSSRTASLKPSASATLVASPTLTTSQSRTQLTNTINPTPTRNTISLSDEVSLSRSKSGATVTLSASPELSPTRTLLPTTSASQSVPRSATESMTKHTVGNLSPSKSDKPSPEASATDSGESSSTETESNEPSETDSLVVSLSPSQDRSATMTATDDESRSVNTMSPSRSSSPTDSDDHSASRSLTSSRSTSIDPSQSPTMSTSASLTGSLSLSEEVSNSVVSYSTTASLSRSTTISLSQSFSLTRTVRTSSQSATAEPTPTTTATSSQTRSVSSSLSTSDTRDVSLSLTVTRMSATLERSASASITPLPSVTLTWTPSSSSSWQFTKGSRSVTPPSSDTRDRSFTATPTEELSPTTSTTTTHSITFSLTASWSVSWSFAAASTTVTRSLLPTKSASASRETTLTVSLSTMPSPSSTGTEGPRTVTVSNTPSSSVSLTHCSGTSDASRSPTRSLSQTHSEDRSSSLRSATPTLSDDRTATLSTSPSSTIRVATTTTSISTSRDDSSTESKSGTSSGETTNSVATGTPTLTSSLSVTVAFYSTTFVWSRSPYLSLTSSRGSKSASTESSATTTPTVSPAVSTTPSNTRGTQSTTRAATMSAPLSATRSTTNEISVSALTQTLTPTRSSSLTQTKTLSLLQTKTRTSGVSLSPSNPSSSSRTCTLTHDDASASWSDTAIQSTTASRTASETVQWSATYSSSASHSDSPSPRLLSSSASNSPSSTKSTTKSHNVSETRNTLTIHAVVALAFVFAPRNIAGWAADGVPIIEVLSNQSTAPDQQVVDVTLYPIDHDTGEAPDTPYRSPVVVSAALLPTNEVRDIVAIDAEGFPRSINITTSNAVLPAHIVVSMSEALPDEACTAPAFNANSGTLRVGIQYTHLDMEYYSQSAQVLMTHVSPVTTASTSGACVGLAHTPTSPFLACDVPQLVTVRLERAGYFSVAAASMSLSPSNATSINLLASTMLGSPIQWVHLESALDQEEVPFIMHSTGSVASAVVPYVTSHVAVWVGSHVAAQSPVAVYTCPRRYATQGSIANVMFNVSDGLVRMPYTVVSSVAPTDRWRCTITTNMTRWSTIAVRQNGCMLHCPVPLFADALFSVTAALELNQIVVSTIAWPTTLLTSSHVHGSIQKLLATSLTSPAGWASLRMSSVPIALPLNGTIRGIVLHVVVADEAVPLAELGMEISQVLLQVNDLAIDVTSGSYIARDGHVHIDVPTWDICSVAAVLDGLDGVTLAMSVALSLCEPLSSLRITVVANATLQCMGRCPVSVDADDTNATDNVTLAPTPSTTNATPGAAPISFLYAQGCAIDVFPVTTSCIAGNVVTLRLDSWSSLTNGASLEEYTLVLVRRDLSVTNGTTTIVTMDANCTGITWSPATHSASCTLPALPAASIATVELRLERAANTTTVALLSDAVYYSNLKYDGCPKSAINATCSNHGTCDVLTLTCTCDSDEVLGFYTGTQCGVCSAGFYGPGCTGRCPGAGCSLCSGHGRCSDGEGGNGICTCDNTSASGFWSSSDCSDCDPNYYGVNCTMKCVTDLINGLVCGGHGVCSSGVAGSGQCTCDVGFTSTNAASCTACQGGYYGSACTACPTSLSLVPCSGHGVCSDGVAGNGSCACLLGFGGASCSAACPVTLNKTCGWGNCVENGTCVCTLPITINTTTGTCSTCVAGWWGTRCTNPCLCTFGTCDPRTGSCACNFGYWGPTCASICPGGATKPCSGHGTCLASNGTCVCYANSTHGHYSGTTCSTCDPLYDSPNCNVMCPYDAATLEPCARRGVCYNGTCSGRCIIGYYGALCVDECPGGADNPCSNHGTCDETSGVCTCTYGYAGSACQNECPPGDGTSPPCYAHGVCTDTGACSCYANGTAGYWSGTSCEGCALQYSGASCTVLCNPSGGRVSGTLCVCSSGFVGPSCNLVCPSGSDGAVCSGQGQCSDVDSKAVCTCFDEYYGIACDTWCTAANCVATLDLYRAQCNVSTGECECLMSTLGMFTGTLCDACLFGYWGAECDFACSCNGRSCERYSASCVCSAGFGGGLWAGDACDVCADTYIGVSCTQRNIDMNNSTSASFSSVNGGYPSAGIHFHDPVTDVILVGSNPVGVFQTAAWTPLMTPLATFWLASVAVDCSALNATHLSIRLMPASPQQLPPVVYVQRSPLAAGIIILTGTNSTHQTNATVDDHPLLTAHRTLASQSTSTFSMVTNANDTSFDGPSLCTMFAVGTTWQLQCPAGNLTMTTPSDVVWMGFVGTDIAVVTWTDAASAAWGLRVVRLPNATHRTPTVLLSTTGAIITVADCESYGGCSTIGHCVSPRDATGNASTSLWSHTVIVCGASTALTTGNSLIFLAIDYATGTMVGSSVVVPSASGLTASIVDAGYGNAIFAFVGATTAMLCRIQLSSPLTLITLFSVDRVNGERPDVLSMSINSTTRTLWLSVATSEAIVAVAVNLFSIRVVTPAVFDQLGGVTVTVTGIGFVPHPTPRCDFYTNNTASVPSPSLSWATFINSTTLLCVAASVSQYDASCTTLMLNVWYGGRVTSTTLGGTMRPLTATIHTATTALSGGMPRTLHTANTIITLSGFGFVVSAAQAACRIEDANGSVVAVLAALPVSATVAYCYQSSDITPTHRNAGIRYSHDGYVFSATATFAVVGEWAGLQVSVASAGSSTSVDVAANLVALLPSMLVETTDSNGNVLGLLDATSRQVICSSIAPSLLADVTAHQLLFSTSSTTTLSTTDGSVAFSNVLLASPLTGSQALYFFSTLDRTAYATIDVTIVPGTPTTISFSTGTSQASWYYGVTTTFTVPSFSVVILDAVGNTVVDESQLPTSVLVQYTNTGPSDASPTAVSFASSLDPKTTSYPFAGLSARSSFGNAVTLRFTTTSDSTIQGFVYTMGAENCGAGSYGVKGGYECLLCPQHASCDGTTTITAASGYWRGTVTSPYLYACTPSDSCQSSTTCAAGYEGVNCGSCEAGYGRTVSSCDLCGSVAAPWVFVVLIVLGVIVGVWALALRTVAFSAPVDVEARVVELPAKQSATSILAKIALSHIQILSLLPLRRLAVGFVASALSSSGSWSVVTPGFLNVACAIGRRAVNEMYATVALAGLAGVGLCAAAYAVAWGHDQRFRSEAKRSAAAQRAKVAKLAKASPVLFRAADEAHAAALFQSNAQRQEVLRNHVELLEEYEGDAARTRIDADDIQGWMALEFDIDDDRASEEDFISLADLAARANGGLAPADGIAAVGAQRPALWKRWTNVTLLGIIVVTFLVYPTVVQAAVRVIQCTTVQLGDGASVSVLAYDPAVDCESSEYTAGQVPAVAVLLAFGGGVPLLSPLAILFAKRYTCDRSLQRACQLFFFVTGGYRLWFWEGIVLARKAVIVVVVVLVGDDQVVCIITMWLLGTSLMLNLVLLPWEAERLGALESLSLGALSLTSLCLAAFSSSGDGMGDAVSMGLVVVVAAINTAVLAALAVELSRQATAEVIEMTGLELPPQWEIDSLRERIQVTLRQLRRRRCSRVANVSELLSTAHRVTLTLLSRRRASMLALTYKAELNRKGNEVSDRERMMHYDWDTAALSTDNSDEEGGDLHTATKDTSHHVIEYLRPATGPSDENQRSSRPRSVVFDAPDARATVWSVSSSSDAMDVGANQSDIVNPFLGTCFEDNPWDVLVRTGHDRQFLRSRDRSQQALTTFSDLGYFDDTHDAFDLDAAISIATSSASSSADHRNSSRYFLKSRERAAALARPSWALPSTDAITWADVELPGVANDVGDFDGDISVGDIDLNETRVLTTVWEEVATPSLIEFDDDDFDFRPPQQAPSVAQRAVRPQRFTSEVAARRCVAAAASMLESQLLGAARTFWAVLSDIRTATALLSIVKVQRLNQRLASLLEELYEAEFQFVHVVWSYEHYVRSGAWDAVGSANMELEGTIEKEAAQGAHTSSEDKYLSKESLDLSDYEFDASDMLHK